MQVIAANEIPLYAGPKITSNCGIRDEVRIFENALAEVRRREDVYKRPALKKYGDNLDHPISDDSQPSFLLEICVGELDG